MQLHINPQFPTISQLEQFKYCVRSVTMLYVVVNNIVTPIVLPGQAPYLT